jgi:hypothetical protein
VHLPKNDYPCTAHNLSRSGALLAGRFPRLTGYRVEVSIGYPQGEVNLRLAGRVVRTRDVEDGQQKLALEFVELTEERREALEALLARIIEGHCPAPIEALKPGAAPDQVRRALELVPVPHRISLAARANPRERLFLRQDPHPQVLEALARNPNLLPAEARALAAVPHLQPSTLELLSRDPRWAKDDEVRAALLSHPRIPPTLVQKIVDGADPQSVMKLAQVPGIPSAIRMQLKRRALR